MRLLHARNDPDCGGSPAANPGPDPRRYRQCHIGQHLPLYRLRPDRRSRGARRQAAGRIEYAARAAAGRGRMSAQPFRFVATPRRVREDRRFVAGRGNFVADVNLPGMLHVALVPSQHAAARILSIDASSALAMPGVHAVATGAELAAAADPLMNGLDTPRVRRFPLAVGQVRYNGEWVAAGAAETRALAEDTAERVAVGYEPLPFVLDPEQALRPESPAVHPDHGSNILLDRTFLWGEVERHFAQSPRQLSFRVTWGRNSTVPVETFGVVAAWDPWNELLDVWA